MDDRELDLLGRLSRLCGIVDGYHDIWGAYHPTAPETQRAVLAAMGIRTDSLEELEAEFRRRETAREDQLCAPVTVLAEGGSQEFEICMPARSEPCEAFLQAEGKAQRLELHPLSGGSQWARLTDPLPAGLYEAEVGLGPSCAGPGCRTLVAVCPPTGYERERVGREDRIWGVNVPLYGLRSTRNWGIGDFGDLRAAVDWAADLGADYVGTLPLHALFNESPYGLSPYYPSSRLFLNPVYIAVDRVPEASAPLVRGFIDRRGTRRRIEALRSSELVDYPGAWNLKKEALRRAYQAFRSHHLDAARGPTPRGCAFTAWRSAEGRALEDFATFSALREHLTSERRLASTWQQWPPELRCPDSQEVRQFRCDHPDEVAFHEYLQWLAHDQLQSVTDLAKARGMSVGLYLDLALGVDPCGADAWTYQSVLALGASAGCPPDPFSLLGQRWGVPPAIPDRHRETGYALFLETLRRVASLCGALRVDHVLALWRLFWVPGALPPSCGAYVSDRPDELLGLLRLVSRESRCLIVGEDLGTIPPEVRAGLAASGFYSYRVLIFEKDGCGRFKPPSAYPQQALACVATHDLPTLDGFWLGRDIEVKRALRRYPDSKSQEEDLEGRKQDRLRLLEALAAEGLLPDGVETDHRVAEDHLDALAAAVHAFLAKTPCALMLANLDDLVGSREMQNLPGTLDEHPNWRRKAALPVEAWHDLDRPRRIADAVRSQGRGDRI